MKNIVLLIVVVVLSACNSDVDDGINLLRQGSYVAAIEKLTPEAEGGSKKAQKALGLIYMEGKGVERVLDTSIKWFLLASEQGDQSSQYNAGALLSERGDYQEAAKWYEEAAKQGHLNAMFNLAVLHSDNHLTKPDYGKARYWLEKAVAEGHRESHYQLGLIYERGLGIEQDYTKAFDLRLHAAEQGYSLAQVYIGQAYREGLGVNINKSEAEKWFRKSVKSGDIEGTFNLGHLYSFDDGFSHKKREGYELLIQAGNAGYTQAQYLLGYFLKIGNGPSVKKNSYGSHQWYLLAAESGDAVAQYFVGLNYMNGAGVPKDNDQGKYWMIKAAESGDADAQYWVGDSYRRGVDGYELDYKKAWQWSESSMRKGDSGGMYSLGAMNHAGEGRVKSYVDAHMWYTLAALYADKGTRHTYKNEVEIVEKLLSLSEVKQSLDQARSWQDSFTEVGILPK